MSREFAIPIRRIEEIIDRALLTFDPQNQLRAFKRELRRLEDLSGEFFILAKREKNPECAHLFARLNERICAMRGIGNVRMDPLQVEVAQQPSRHDRIVEAFKRLQDSAPPAAKALRERLDEMSAEQALELLGPPQPKGNGAAPSDDPDPK